jgi:4'-phosphopantetheinyl transferase
VKIYSVDMQGFSYADLHQKAFSFTGDDDPAGLSGIRDATAALHKLVSFLLVRTVLSLEGFPRGSFAILRDSFGKPFAEGAAVHFNVSHSGRWCVCAVSKKNVGVDVQAYRTIDRAVAARFFSSAEALRLDSLTGEDYAREFFRIWSLKESYIKCIGKGLSHPLNSFTIEPEDDDGLFLEGIPAKSFDSYEGYSLAACAEDGVFPSAVQSLLMDEILPE